jgi:hypothetical protein
MIKIKFNIFIICVIVFFITSHTSFCSSILDSTNRANSSGNGFKTGTVSVFKTAKWIFPVITLLGGGAYFYFDKKADDNFNNYQNTSSRELAVDYRAKTKDNDQLANISGITAIVSAAISVFAWIMDDNKKFESGEEYKFTLTYGRQLTGYFIREDFDSYLIQTKEGAVTVKRSDIARIEKEGLIIFEK